MILTGNCCLILSMLNYVRTTQRCAVGNVADSGEEGTSTAGDERRR